MFEIGKKEKSGESAEVLGSKSGQGAASWEQGSGGKSSSARPAEMAVIGHSIRIDGDLVGEEDLRIEGDVRGTVQLRNNTLTIGAKGKISANVFAKSVTVDGIMNGDIYGSERVTIRKNAEVTGNITAPRVSLEDGARFKGSIEMDPAAIEKALGIKVDTGASQGASQGARPAARAGGVQANGDAQAKQPVTSGATGKSGVKAETLT